MNNYNPYYMTDYNLNNGDNFFYVNENRPTAMDPYLGFTRGNLFDQLYTPYKNYQLREIKPQNEREQLLFNLSMYSFAAHELALYLDTHPTDSNAIKLRSEYVMLSKKANDEYEQKYGALDMGSDTLFKDPWGWTTPNWPWDGDM